MKKAAAVILCIIIFLCGCGGKGKNKTTRIYETGPYTTGVWMTYSEINSMLKKGDFKSEFKKAAENLKTAEITDLYFHVRPFCDSYYKSEFFPINSLAEDLGYDLLEYVISTCHSEGIRVHAWINPYRVKRNTQDIESLDKKSPAYIWLTDGDTENDRNVIICEEGIFLNPASAEARMLVINGIREILKNYAVDGIHFDDYFYPSTEEKTDEKDYSDYCSSVSSPLELSDWRRTNVNALISGVYTAVKFENKNITFSISPAASIEKNYSDLYADIRQWIKCGCVDDIIPQLYFGFEYPDEDFCFDKLLEVWKEAVKGSNVRLIAGLASYKIGTTAPADKEEWANGKEIISKQVSICKSDKNISGHIYFSYSYLFSENIKQ